MVQKKTSLTNVKVNKLLVLVASRNFDWMINIMTFEQRCSSLVLHQMMSDYNNSDLAPQRQEMFVENVSSGLVPQGQKASDYDNSDPVPPRQNVVPTT
ncbi:hypothetical protein Tco_0387848 [Tanacetum coccineum]